MLSSENPYRPALRTAGEFRFTPPRGTGCENGAKSYVTFPMEAG